MLDELSAHLNEEEDDKLSKNTTKGLPEKAQSKTKSTQKKSSQKSDTSTGTKLARTVRSSGKNARRFFTKAGKLLRGRN